MINKILLIISELVEKIIHVGLPQKCKNNTIVLKNRGIDILNKKIDEQSCKNIIKKFEEYSNTNYTTTDDLGCDTRIFGFEKIFPESKNIFENIDFFNIAKSFYKTDRLSYTIMVNKTIMKTNSEGSGGGWHRDSPIRRQLKAMIYLNDVNENNGCFSYIPYSCKSISKISSSINQNFHWKKYRFTKDEIDKVLNKEELLHCVGPTGTTILFNSKGLHKGNKVIKGERYAMTIYCYKKNLPSSIRDMIKI